MLPTVSCPGLFAPRNLFFISFTPAACNNRYDVVGVRRSNENVRSGRTVTRAGIGTPVLIWAVRALNSWGLGQCMSSGQAKNYCYLAKVHTFDSFTAQGWTNWRTWACLTGSDDELHDLIPGCHFSRHLELLVRRSGMSLDDD